MNIAPNAFASPALLETSADHPVASKPGSRDFATILADHASASAASHISRPVSPMSSARQRQEVFSFGALGVFGRYGASAENALNPPTNPASMNSVAAPFPGDDRSDEQIAEKLTPNYAGEAVTGDAVNLADARIPLSSVTEEGQASEHKSEIAVPQGESSIKENIAQQTVPGQPSAPGIAEQAPLSRRASTRSRACMHRDNESSSGDAGSVTVFESDSAIGIVVRNTDTSIGSDTLQHAFLETAAEFGEKVSKMLINGETQNFTTFLGGNHGRRAG